MAFARKKEEVDSFLWVFWGVVFFGVFFGVCALECCLRCVFWSVLRGVLDVFDGFRLFWRGLVVYFWNVLGCFGVFWSVWGA